MIDFVSAALYNYIEAFCWFDPLLLMTSPAKRSASLC